MCARPDAAVSSTKRGAPSAEPDVAAPGAPTATSRARPPRAGRRRSRAADPAACGGSRRARPAVSSVRTCGAMVTAGRRRRGRAGVRSRAAAVRRPAANSASITRRLATASSGSTGSGAPSRTASANRLRLARRTGRPSSNVSVSVAGRDRRIAAGGHEDPRRPVGRDVERDLDRDPALGAVDVDALVGLGPRRAGERRDARRRTRGSRWSARRRPMAGSRTIAAWTRVGLGAEQHPRQVDRVAADVVQGAAARPRGCCGCWPGRR